MNGFMPKLLSLDVPYCYVEAGDIVRLTLTWQNAGDRPYDGDAKMAVDIRFDRAQRHLENQADGFRTTWEPFPALHQWMPGDVITTTGSWKVPETWCGSFFLDVSLVGDDGRAIPFLGKEGREVLRQEMIDIDLGWGWGHVKLVEQRHPIHHVIGEAVAMTAEASTPETVSLGEWVLDARYPAVVGYKGRRWRSQPPVATVRDTRTAAIRRCLSEEERPQFSPAVIGDSAVHYGVRGVFGEVTMVMTRQGDALFLTVEDCKPSEAFELISLSYPRLAVWEEDGTLLNFFCGGRKVSITESHPMRAAFPYDVCNALAGYDETGGVVAVSDDMESILYQAVEERNGCKYGVIGGEQMLLVPSLTTEVPSIPVPPMPLELHPLPEPSWQGFACFMRDRLPEGVPDRYPDTLFYKISADKTLEMDENRPMTWSKPISFPQIRHIIERIYHITGGMRQVVYLVGWQRNGHDTEYPFPYRHGFSPRLGEEQWEESQRFAKEHRAILSFHDNFDDVYCFDGLDPAWLATDCRGRKKKGWLWAGGMSYILSPKAYCLSGEMAHRVKEMVERYHIEESYHLDVLTSEVRRHDFSPDAPCGARENVLYKRKIVEEFNSYGVDVTSESLAMPFIGSIGYALHTRYHFGETLFSSECVIPLTTMMYHGKIRYNMGALSERDRLLATAYGASCGLDCLGTELGVEHIRSLYLHAMPMQHLATKIVTACESTKGYSRLTYGDNSCVEVDFTTGAVTIVADGKTLVQDGLAVLPAFDREGDLLLFSLTDRELTLPMASQAVTVTELTFEGERDAHVVTVRDGVLSLKLSADCPLRITPC